MVEKDGETEMTRDAATMDAVMRARRTAKVLACDADPSDTNSNDRVDTRDLERHRRLVMAAIESAGWAPFHYDRRIEGVAEPWRFHWLDRTICRELSTELPRMAVDMKPGNKLPKMLAACGSLVIVNWLPEASSDDLGKMAQVNEEHLAATAAAVQNLLLGLQSRGLGTYWSSGGSLRDASVYEALGIDPAERLLAAVFVDDPQLRAGIEVETIEGKNRSKRSELHAWCRIVDKPTWPSD